MLGSFDEASHKFECDQESSLYVKGTFASSICSVSNNQMLVMTERRKHVTENVLLVVVNW